MEGKEYPRKIEIGWGDAVHILLGLITGLLLKTLIGTIILIVYFIYQVRDFKEDYVTSTKDLAVFITSVLIGYSIT